MVDYSKIRSFEDIRFQKEKLRNRYKLAEVKLDGDISELKTYFSPSYWWSYLNQRYQLGLQILNALSGSLSFFKKGNRKKKKKVPENHD